MARPKVVQWPRIRKRKNPGGTVSWLVDLSTATTRERKFFKTEEAAETFAEQRRIDRTNHGTASLSLSEDQRREAVELSQRLRLVGSTLTDAVEFYFKHAKPDGGNKTVNQVIAELASKRAAAGRNADYPSALLAAVSLDLLPPFIRENYEVHEWKHASAVLKTDFPNEWKDVNDVLGAFRFKKGHIVVGGGGKTKVAQSLDAAFVGRGWIEKKFYTKIQVDEEVKESPTHKVDCFKNKIALEIEWSNKDPFYDRDLNNFRLLFDLRVISVGIIVTKADELRSLFEELKIISKYGSSTTWMSKLLPRIEGGGGGGCPILVFGIKKSLYDGSE
jgi:hypothetical protein